MYVRDKDSLEKGIDICNDLGSLDFQINNISKILYYNIDLFYIYYVIYLLLMFVEKQFFEAKESIIIKSLYFSFGIVFWLES